MRLRLRERHGLAAFCNHRVVELGDPRALSLIVSSEEQRGGRDAISAFVSASGGARAMADRALKTR